MTTNAKGPVSVSNTAELRTALLAGYTADEIEVVDTRAQVATARNEGLVAGRAEAASQIESARSEGVAQGRREELQRIQAVQSSGLPGHEALIQSLMFDGKTTGAEAAAKVIAAERANRGKRIEDLNADAAAITTPAVAAPAPAPAKPKIDPSLPAEDRCKAEWQHDPELRAEFGNDLESYVAYTKAHEGGRVKALRNRTDK